MAVKDDDGTAGPKTGNGWHGWLEPAEGFDEDEFNPWDSLETKEDGTVDYEHYSFDNMAELVNFIAGTGSYQERNSFKPTSEDMNQQRNALKQAAGPQCPKCLEDIEEYLEEGAMRGEINIDPYMTKRVFVDQEDTQYSHDFDYVNRATFVAYCEEHEGIHVTYEESWYSDEGDENPNGAD